VVFRLGTTLSLLVELDVNPDTVGKDTLGREPVGKGIGVLVCERLIAGTEMLPPVGKAVPFRPGTPLLPPTELVKSPELVDSDSVGSGSVGNGTELPARDMLMVGIEIFPLGEEAVPFRPGN
jgi:hypothetical protein